jgi:heat shock protein HtpX
MAKRVFLLIVTNLAIVFVLGLVVSVLGLDRYPVGEGGGIPFGSLLVMATVFGFGGAFISLLISKPMAKFQTGARVIEQPSSELEAWLLATVRHQADRLGIKMPEVAVFDSPDMNAFATGARKNAALVAVSTGLVRGMSRDEVEAVLGHEMSHVANGDMVTLTLIQGVLNTFVLFLSRVIGFVVDRMINGNSERERGPGPVAYMISIVSQIVLGIVASFIVAWFSRQREYRADAGGASVAAKSKMIAALERLRASQEPSHLPDAVAAFGIRPKKGGLWALMASHPPLEDRIARLQSSSTR